MGYTVAGFRLGGEYSMLTEAGVDDIWNVSASYTLGALVLSAADDNVQDVSIGAVYTVTEGVTAGITYHTGTTQDADTTNDSSYIDLVAGYTGNGISINASADNVTSANSKNLQWSVEASYDLGGGLAVNGGINYTEDVYVGASMTF